MKNSKFFKQKGFSLVEFTVAVAIFAIVSAVLITTNFRFRDEVLITNLAYDTALAIREAQSYGVSVRGFAGAERPEERFTKSYGVHFSKSRPDSFVLFVDADGDKEYDGGGAGSCSAEPGRECLRVYIFGQGNRLKEFCREERGEGRACYDFTDAGRRLIDSLDIIFTRPNPDAEIYTDGNDGVLYNGAAVTLITRDGKERELSVTNTGQITVN